MCIQSKTPTAAHADFFSWDGALTHPNPSNWTVCFLPYVQFCILLSSAAEAKLGTLFLNCKQATIFLLILEEKGHPQMPTPIHCDNSTAIGITNNTVKGQRSCSMERDFLGCRHCGTREI
jgi:hypothetical protein